MPCRVSRSDRVSAGTQDGGEGEAGGASVIRQGLGEVEEYSGGPDAGVQMLQLFIFKNNGVLTAGLKKKNQEGPLLSSTSAHPLSIHRWPINYSRALSDLLLDRKLLRPAREDLYARFQQAFASEWLPKN